MRCSSAIIYMSQRVLRVRTDRSSFNRIDGLAAGRQSLPILISISGLHSLLALARRSACHCNRRRRLSVAIVVANFCNSQRNGRLLARARASIKIGARIQSEFRIQIMHA